MWFPRFRCCRWRQRGRSRFGGLHVNATGVDDATDIFHIYVVYDFEHHLADHIKYDQFDDVDDRGAM
ncbi:MAG: hypothetical protein GXP36_04795 [Actinobacteria bacterium]|nr:hypothetical protein [Actinomycetota bacterium]